MCVAGTDDTELVGVGVNVCCSGKAPLPRIAYVATRGNAGQGCGDAQGVDFEIGPFVSR